MLVGSRFARGRFSVKEKDEASPLELFSGGARMPSFPDCRSLKVFCFQAPHWSPNRSVLEFVKDPL